MNTFSISQLSQLSGIKSHTIRIWEQRYKALQPLRSEGNTRYYDSSQLRRLLNIVSLMDEGYKISELGVLPKCAVEKILKQSGRSVCRQSQSVSFLTSCQSSIFRSLFFRSTVVL
jgi:DNA-binding transcriptional MerR regulator